MSCQREARRSFDGAGEGEADKRGTGESVDGMRYLVSWVVRCRRFWFGRC